MDATARPGDGGDDVTRPLRRRRVTWSLFSALCAALLVLAAGGLGAVLYPILTELRGERVRGANDGLLVAVLGFRSILVLSVLGGCTCSAFSCSLTYLDGYTPGGAHFLSQLRHAPGRYAVALMNGCMASLVVAWNLS